MSNYFNRRNGIAFENLLTIEKAPNEVIILANNAQSGNNENRIYEIGL